VSGGSSTPVQGSLDTPPLLLYDEGAEDIKIRVLGPGCLSREGTLPRLADVLYEQDLSGVLAVHFVSAAVPIEVGLADRERVPSGTVVRTLPALVGKEQLGTSFTTPCELPLGDPVYVPARRPLRLELRFSAGEERTWNQVAEIQTPGVTDMLPGFYEVSSGDVPRNWRFRVTLRGRDVSGNAKCRVPRVTAVFPCDDGVLLTRAPRAVEVTADLPGGIQITGKARPVADPELESAIAAAVSDAVTARLSLAPTGCWLTIRPRTSSGREAVIHRVVSIGPKGTVRRFVDEAFLPPGRYRLQIWYRIPGRAGLVSHELRRTLVDSDTCELSAALPTP